VLGAETGWNLAFFRGEAWCVDQTNHVALLQKGNIVFQSFDWPLATAPEIAQGLIRCATIAALAVRHTPLLYKPAHRNKRWVRRSLFVITKTLALSVKITVGGIKLR